MLARDEVVREALGAHVFERLTEAQRQEWDALRLHVTEWEPYLAQYQGRLWQVKWGRRTAWRPRQARQGALLP